MKRVLALLLVLSVMLSVLVLHVNAITESKITPKLAEKLNEMKDDEKIEVWIEASFNYFDEEKLEQICEEECGFSRDQIETMEQADLWRRTWNQAVNNALYEAVVDIFEKMDYQKTCDNVIDNALLYGELISFTNWKKKYEEYQN